MEAKVHHTGFHFLFSLTQGAAIIPSANVFFGTGYLTNGFDLVDLVVVILKVRRVQLNLDDPLFFESHIQFLLILGIGREGQAGDQGHKRQRILATK